MENQTSNMGLDSRQQWAGQAVLEYLENLFTQTTKASFTKESILVILNHVRNDPELFFPELVVAFDSAVDDEEMER